MVKIFHDIKKGLGVNKSEKIKDSDFENMYKNQVLSSMSDSKKLKDNLRVTYTHWESMEKNVSSLYSILGEKPTFSDPGPISSFYGKDKGANATGDYIQDWKESLTETKLKEVDELNKLLDAYMSACQKIKDQYAKRETCLSELQYYQGKADKLSKKGKAKDELSLQQAERVAQNQQEYYETINSQMLDNMNSLLANKDQIWEYYKLGYIEIQRIQSQNMMNVCSSAQSEQQIGSEDLTREIQSLTTQIPTSVLEISGPPDSAAAKHKSSGQHTSARGSNSNESDSYNNNANSYTSNDLTGKTVRVDYEFRAENKDELNLRVGDRVTIVEKIDENWYYGRTNDYREGMFPSNYVSAN